MTIKFVPSGAAILALLLISGCVKQHTKWHEVALSPTLPFPYVPIAPRSEPRPGLQLTPGIPLSTHPTSRTGLPSSNSSTNFFGSSSRGSSSGGGNHRSGGYLSRSEKRWWAVALLLVFLGAPLAWLFYPSWRRSRSQERTTSTIPAPQVPPRETWDAEGLCPNCGSSMVQRVAKRGRHAGKSFYGCSKYPRCTGIRQA
ncbi:topoisomerase DNA-binding C4 zinc finger domain-containing protein [Pseudomonas peradeniyensis]|uniref:topoisomerase DNA-binding C4 zinc finger domain-containing protein n=1 Tax=Pseudomonas peradeniyensis TaxID=2745488 RepID=UPI0021D49846|nr:topoisomerase DNA-binding C4 zinc finger domain-containing protein [Pseudomonas peradeniyensis]MCU7283266.1 topoisomerase DNA-binding C4 zinc finger domain-containing protein [Pseudomonas peradeniyensis]